ncbi:acyl-CoA-binding protein [Tenacibaculum sp. M341]|uniref:acyl-CoA-binding protein n=1 Tax=Tenacibaculum sp. M341 TaxID=2530339 RepID=UPI0010539681|nr:acyl-CoA-binding protein [Tenacibaculum sp. M341]TCI85410.1 phosphatidylserine decarboxylase [Tenacibaculum sp. M341]
MNSDLDIQFSNAVKKVSETEEKFAPDVLLRLYAYYKQATKGDQFDFNNEEDNLKNAFKFNAWIQLKGMNETEAKENYIKLVNSILK